MSSLASSSATCCIAGLRHCKASTFRPDLPCKQTTVVSGLEHYEVSNFAMPGHRCAHNMAYWEGRSYYAFGLGSASYLEVRAASRCGVVY